MVTSGALVSGTRVAGTLAADAMVPPDRSVHGIGIDIADVPRFRRLLGGAFLRRWFTPLERAVIDSADDRAPVAAALFAAKEAAWKSLALDGWDGRVPWAWIGIVPLGLQQQRGRVLLAGPVAAHAPHGLVINACWSVTERVATAVAVCVSAAR